MGNEPCAKPSYPFTRGAAPRERRSENPVSRCLSLATPLPAYQRAVTMNPRRIPFSLARAASMEDGAAKTKLLSTPISRRDALMSAGALAVAGVLPVAAHMNQLLFNRAAKMKERSVKKQLPGNFHRSRARLVASRKSNEKSHPAKIVPCRCKQWGHCSGIWMPNEN